MNNCIVCNNTDNRKLYTGIVQCQECGHIFSDLSLSEGELCGLYDEGYFFGNEYYDYLSDRKVSEKNFELRLRILRKFIEPNRHKSLLEVGCAYGFFLAMAKDLFEVSLGVDITKDGIRYAKEILGLNAINAEFLTYDLGCRKFDVVCMWDTIEHLLNPRLYIEKIAGHIEEGGLLAITTGDVDSINARLNKDRWRLIHPPTHMHYFSRRTLAKLLDENGFDIVYNRYCGFYRSLGMAAHGARILNKSMPRLNTFLKRSGLDRCNFYLNLYDIMYVVARKRK